MNGVMVRVLEELNVFAPLGIRFWDDVTDSQIRDALLVRIWPEERPQLAREAYRTISDVYAFRKIPGLLDLENRPWVPPDGEDETSPPAPRGYIVQVDDLRRRYQTVAFRVELPLEYSGVYLAGSQFSPLEPSTQGFVLLSSPTRPPSTSLAVVRGELADVATDEPAPHALIRILIEGEPNWYALADEAGRFLLLLPWPTLAEGLGGSPENGNTSPLESRTWQVQVEVFYQPDGQSALPGATVPDYLSLLLQDQAGIWETHPDDGGTEVSEWVGDLSYGVDLILRTEGRSRLFISPASSP